MNGIRTQREAHGMSQTELAGRLGVSSTAVNKWEAGASMPRLKNLRAMVVIFGCTMDDLCGDDPPTESAS